jgi:hypothetical protein
MLRLGQPKWVANAVTNNAVTNIVKVRGFRGMKRVKVLGLVFIAALSVMAVTAVAANAAMEVRVKGKTLGAGESAQYEGTGGLGKLLVAGLKLTIHCTGADAKGTLSNVGGMGHGTVHILFLGCTVEGSGSCTIYPTEAAANANTNNGQILASALGLVVLSGGNLFILGSPLPGQAFSTIYYGQEGGCTLPEETEVTGTAALKILNGTTEATTHEVVDADATDEAGLGDKLFYGEETAILDGGSATIKLVGALAGEPFSLTP